MYFLSILFLFVSFFVEAQTAKIDSLKQFLQTYPSEDTIKANTIQLLCKTYLIEMNDKEKMNDWANKLYALSTKINYRKGIGYAFLSMGTVNLGRGNYETALMYYFKSLKLLEKAGDKKTMGACYSNIGNVKNNQGKYSEALEYALKGLALRIETGDKQGEASNYNNIGLTYSNLGNYQKALEYHFRSLNLKESIDDKLGVSISYLNIGNVLEEQNKFDEAREYQRKALILKIESGDKEGESMVYNNLANGYNRQKNYMEALIYHLKSLKIKEEIGDKQGIAMSYINIGNNYKTQDKINEAISYYLKGLKLSEEQGEKLNIASSCIGLGNCYEQQKNYTRALNYYRQGLYISKQINYKIGMRDAYFYLASVNEKLNNFQAALAYNKLFSSVKDTMLNEESMKQAVELSTRYETDKKEKEILLLTKDQELKDKTLKEQRLVRIGLIIGLGLLLALSFLLYNRYRLKQKSNVLLQKQKEEIHQKNTLITDSIDYAKTIQEAILPDDDKLTSFFPDHFILYKPKAIVSGDFYWIGKKDTKIICAVADCTGHGVPGAFMSLLGHNILENVVQRETSRDPGAILTALNEEIVTRFSKGKKRETVKHGMDIAIISIDPLKQQLEYAGARNSLYLIRNNILTEIKADKMSTGIVNQEEEEEIHYTNKSNALQKGDMLYLFSDGFPDQKGGPEKKKFYYQPFKDLLVSIHTFPVAEQQAKLNETILSWMGAREQMDDILVMGIRC